MSRLLLAEDDDGIRAPLAEALRRDGHEVVECADGLEAEQLGLGDGVDLLILDRGLPGRDGLSVCRTVRAARPNVPILILTAMGEELDAVAGLDAGADDYVSKPFRLAELLARVRTRLRGAGPLRTQVADIELDEASRQVWEGGRLLDLTPKEFDLLALLVREAGKVVTRDRIMTEVWDANWYGSTKTLDVHVSSLRRKLDDPTPLTTVRGVGLRFER